MNFSIDRKGLLALGAVLGLMLAFAASAGAAPLVVVGNWDGESVSIINSQTHATVGEPIPLAGTGSAVAIAPNGQAFVSETDAEEVAVIDTKTQKLVTSIPVGGSFEYLAVSPDGKMVYVANEELEEITIIDTATDAVTGSIPLVGEPYGVSFSPDGSFAYVTVEGEFLERIDTATGKVVGGPIMTGDNPVTIAFAPGGGTAYVADADSAEVSIVDTTLNETVASIPLPGTDPWGVALSPDGSRLYVSNQKTAGSIYVIDTQTPQVVGSPIPVGNDPYEIALTPDGKTLWVALYGAKQVVPFDTATNAVGAPVAMPELGQWELAVTPDLSPTAVFAPPSASAGIPATFNGGASTDPDGTVASWNWAFGDGATATGVGPAHTYAKAGTYNAELFVVDNEGCGVATVFTGRTAYCAGSPSAKAVHPVEVKVTPIVCGARFRLGGVSRNRKNGTARLQVKTPGAGSIYLFGKKVHAVTRKTKKAGSMWLTVHARVQLDKQLKKTHRANVKVRVTFTPTGTCGAPATRHTSFALLRAPRKKHHRG